MPITTAEEAIDFLTQPNMVSFPATLVHGFDSNVMVATPENIATNNARNKETFDKLSADYLAIKQSLGVVNPGNLTYIDQGNSDLVALYGGKGQTLNTTQKNNLIQLLAEQLREVTQGPMGKKFIIYFANELRNDIFSEKCKKPFFQFTESGQSAGDAYDPDNNIIQLNPWRRAVAQDQSRKLRFFDTRRPIIKGITKVGDEDMVEVGLGLSPMFLGWAHEIRHYLDRKTSQYTGEHYDGRQEGIIKSGFNVPYDYKEHMAVFDGDPSKISELTLRMEAKEPLRYIYQTHNHPTEILHEPVKSVLKHSYAFISNNTQKLKTAIMVDQYLQKLPDVSSLSIANDKKSFLVRNMKSRLREYYPQAFQSINVTLRKITDREKSYIKTQKGLNFIDSRQQSRLVDLLQATSPSKVAYVYSRSGGKAEAFANNLKNLLLKKQQRNTLELEALNTKKPAATPLLNMSTPAQVNQKFTIFLQNINELINGNTMTMNQDASSIHPQQPILNLSLNLRQNPNFKYRLRR